LAFHPYPQFIQKLFNVYWVSYVAIRDFQHDT